MATFYWKRQITAEMCRNSQWWGTVAMKSGGFDNKEDRFAFIEKVSMYSLTLAAICKYEDTRDEVDIVELLTEKSVDCLSSKNIEIVQDAVMALFILDVDLEVFFKDHPLKSIFELISFWGVEGTPEPILKLALS
jgi:hypothetical protein